jgi:hypothetical protein
MRRIISALSEIRSLQLQKIGATNERIAEVGQMFSAMDTQLNGLRVGETNERLEEVMMTADFTYAIMEFVQRLMIPAYQTKTFDFERLLKPETTPNYLPVTRYQRRDDLDDLEFVSEKGEARPGSVSDPVKKQFQVYKWQKQFDFSMEVLVNDDLGYFDDVVPAMGRSARRTLEKFVSRMMWNAVTVARLVGLGALYSTTGRLTTARISTARMAFSQRVDLDGNPLVVGLRYIIHHPGLADTVATIQNSTLVPELATNASNVVRGTFTPIEDPYAPGVAPNLPWYALADYRASGVVPFILARRQGMPAPMLLRKKSDIEQVASLLGGGGSVPPIMGDFATGNVVVKVADEWGTYIDGTEGNLFDFNGAYYSSGTAP